MKIILPRGYRRDIPFYDFRMAIGVDYPEYLRQHPERNPTAPVFAAKVRTDAPYPDVQIVVPIEPSALVAYQRGDPSVLVTLAEELFQVYRRFLRDQQAD